MTNRFPEITISGAAEERGFQHGQTLAERIGRTVEFYARIFGKPKAELFKLAAHFKQKIETFNREYALEIEAIAAGADLEPGYIYALNARSEILGLATSECTAIYFRSTRLLGQNWDWAKELEALAVLMRIKQPGKPTIGMLTEPGIIGKIGMNSNGLGVCLNILRINKPLDGVPIHLVLRAVLDAANVQEALERIKAAGPGKASNILMGDNQGHGFSIEFAGDEIFTLTPKHEVLLHTNHYLGRNINPEQSVFCSSYARLRAAVAKTGGIKQQAIADLKSILLDRSNPALPINRPYLPDDELEEVGTVCTIIMDLPNRSIHLKKGHTPGTDFVVYRV
ncbi:MAG: peptidase C45 [Anaerolineae bacterium]|nr:peptidase C45 [Anaerolineae bacterium]